MTTRQTQFNFRPTTETLDTLDWLPAAVTLAVGVPVTKTDVLQLALKELARKYEEYRPKKLSRKSPVRA